MNVLGMFAKHPVAGLVKTRLAADVGDETAARLSAAFIADLAERFLDAADRRVLCYAPGDSAAREYFRDVAARNYDLWPQPPGPLGARLSRFFDEQFAGGAGRRVVVIGSDSPTLPRGFLERAFELLRSHDCVLGPATDGGYYLVGLSGRLLPIFDGVDWSTADVLAETVARITACQAGLALLEPWYDVDSREQLHALRGHVDALRASGSAVDLPHTEPLLQWDTARKDSVL